VIRIGKVSKDQEEYYFAFDNGKWREVKVKNKIWKSVKGAKYFEAELNEDDGTVIKRIYKNEGKVVSVDYFVVDKGELKELNFQCREVGEIISEKVSLCENEKIKVYQYKGKYFDDKVQLQNYMMLELKKEIGNELITLNAKLKAETDKAYLVVIKGKEVWVPKSISTYQEDGTIQVPLWFAKNNSLISEKEYNAIISERLKKYEDELAKIPFL